MPPTLPLQVYYTAGFLLHYVVPQLFSVKSVQQRPPRKGQVASEAIYSLGKRLSAGRCALLLLLAAQWVCRSC